MVSLFLPFIVLTALGSLDSDAVTDKTVSANEFVIEQKIDLFEKEDLTVNYVFAPPTKSVSYGYSNNDYVGYNFYTFSVSNGDTFTFLCDGFYFASFSWNENGNAWRFIFSGDGSSRGIVYVDKNGIISSITLNSVGQVLANSPNFTYTDSTLEFTLIDSGVVTESSGVDDPVPDDPVEPDTPTVSGGDYSDILHSIDDRLSYFEDLFYFGSTLDEMGDGLKLVIVAVFLVALNLVLKIMNWR